MCADQLDLFGAPLAPLAAAAVPVLPDGFTYRREIITPEMEHELLEAIRTLPFKEFEFRGYVGKRRTVSFGAAYDFANERLEAADPMPAFLLGLRQVAAAFAALAPEDLRQVLVTEYGAHAAIGWHRDKGVFGEVIGISLLSACKFRLRRQVGTRWQRVTVEAEPRSAYLLAGAARTEWEHSIPPVETPRYSITYRTIRGK